MPIRKAQFSEHNTIATICAAAFFEEDLFGRVMHPHRHQYPTDVTLFWHAFIRDQWIDWRNRPFVALKRDEKTGEEEVVGIAVWQRQGEGGKRMELSRFDPRESITLSALVLNIFTSIRWC